MYSSATPILFRAITPVHAGSGRQLGIIDMPIQKESHTGIPKIEGASVKGCMREAYHRSNKKEDTNKLFGYENGNDGAALIGFSDAKLLFYPIKSIHQLFTYITCPYLINRFLEDKSFSTGEEMKSILEDIKEGHVHLYTNNKDKLKDEKEIVLDVYDFKIDDVLEEIKLDQTTEKNDTQEICTLYKKLGLKKDIAILSDTDFMEIIFLNREIITRNRIDHETGIVKDGGLFTEEYLPAESVLYSLLLVNGILEGKEEENKKLVEDYQKKDIPKVLQIGGNKTIGKGIVKTVI